MTVSPVVVTLVLFIGVIIALAGSYAAGIGYSRISARSST